MKRIAATIIVAGTMLTGCATEEPTPAPAFTPTNQYTHWETINDFPHLLTEAGLDCEITDTGLDVRGNSQMTCNTQYGLTTGRFHDNPSEAAEWVSHWAVTMGGNWVMTCGFDVEATPCWAVQKMVNGAVFIEPSLAVN